MLIIQLHNMTLNETTVKYDKYAIVVLGYALHVLTCTQMLVVTDVFIIMWG